MKNTEARRQHKWNIIKYNLFGIIWRPLEEKSYLAAARREEPSDGR